MKWKTTWLLLGLAFALFAFIFLVERHWKSTSQAGIAPERLLSFRAADVTNIQLRLTNQFLLRAERTRPDASWNLVLPITYPAQSLRIEWLLQALETLTPSTYIPPGELTAKKRTIAQYGLDIPPATLTLQHNGQRTEILFGSPTAVGDQVYLQVQNRPGVYVVNSEVFYRLPRNYNEWRDTALLNLNGVGWTRLEVRGAGRGFALEFDPTNKTFYLSKPTVARAEPGKVDALLRQLRDASVTKFVSDHPRPDLESYGLQPPALELAFASGTNDLVVVQFGKSPTNDSSKVYARRMSHMNVVLVPKTLLDALQLSQGELRDLRLVNLSSPASVDALEVVGAENFLVRRQTNGTWTVVNSSPAPADSEAVREWMDLLARLEGTVEKDIVTDFSVYGLSPQPARRYLIKSLSTNAAGVVNDRILAELDLGTQQGEKVFARRLDEATVYSLPRSEVARLPREAWQLRDRRVWSFTTNQITRVVVRQLSQSCELQRSPAGVWTVTEGAGVMINSRAMDLIVQPLGELRAAFWVARGDENRAVYGFKDDNNRVTFEVRDGDKTTSLTLELGGVATNHVPYGLAVVDGQTWIFEIPVLTFYELARDLINPLSPKTP
jgi:hypothetical protein